MDSLLVRLETGPYNRSIMAKFLKTAVVAVCALVLSGSLALAQTPEPTPTLNGGTTGQPAAKKKPARKKAPPRKRPAKKKTAKKPATPPPPQQ